MEDLMPGCILAPKLRKLVLVGGFSLNNNQDPTPTLELETFSLDGLPFGSPFIEHLIFVGLALTRDVVLHMHQFDNLQILELISCSIREDFLEPLWTPTGPNTLFLPSLETLIISECSTDWDYAVKKRCAVARPSLQVRIV
jgi:hypothetical protein